MSDTYEKFLRGVWAVTAAAALTATAGIVWIERDVHRALADLPATVTDFHRTLIVAGGAAGDLEKTLRQERQASANQIASATASEQKLNALLDRATQFVDGLDSTNRTLAGAIADQNKSLLTLEQQATKEIADMDAATHVLGGVLMSAGQAAQSAAELAADPHLKRSLEQLDAAMSEANATLVQIDAIAASGNRDAQMIETRLRQALKPASLAKTLFERALGLAGPAAQIATAAK